MAVVTPQAAIAFVIQKRINAAVSQRVLVLRRSTNRITAADIAAIESEIRSDFDEIHDAGRKMFVFKLGTRLALNLINGLGAVGILMLGGWLVYQGETNVGTVVAAVAGLARVAEPWHEIIEFYRCLSEVIVNVNLLVGVLPDPPAETAPA